MMKRFFSIFLFLALVVLGFGCHSTSKAFRIGVDPTWFPLNFYGKEANVFAFSHELLEAIALAEGIKLERVNMDWNSLLDGLDRNRCDAILSSTHPRLYNLGRYDFSEPFLMTGPILVVRKGVELSTLSGMGIAVNSQIDEALLVRNHPGVFVRYYTKVPEVVNAIINEEIDGALIDYIPATNFVHGVDEEGVESDSVPLNDAGLRLISLSQKDKELITLFNQGLSKVKKSGAYDKLLKKWDLAT